MTQNERIEHIVFDLLYVKTLLPRSYSSNGVRNYKFFWSGVLNTRLIEMPSIVFYSGISKVVIDKGYKNDVVNFPLLMSTVTSHYASIKTAFIKVGNSHYLQKIDIKGEIVYIGKGIILDSNQELLFTSTQTYNIIRLDESLYTCNCYFNPKVFTKSNTIYKFIVDSLFTVILKYKLNPQPYQAGTINLIIDNYKGFHDVALNCDPLKITDFVYARLAENIEAVCETMR